MWWVGLLAPNISMSSPGIFENGALARLKMFLLKMVDYSKFPLTVHLTILKLSFSELFGELLHVLPLAVHLKFFCNGQVGWTILAHSYFPNFFVGPLLHALKSPFGLIGVVTGLGLGLGGLGTKGLGTRA